MRYNIHRYVFIFFPESFPEDDVYQYATASYPVGRLSPLPPGQEEYSPNYHHPHGHLGQQHTDIHSHDLQQRSYATLVYQVPSPTDLNSSNIVGTLTFKVCKSSYDNTLVSCCM